MAEELEALKPTLKAFRYRQLETLLQAGEWRQADQETSRLMITTVGKEMGQTLDPEDLTNFPCDDLLTLDQLWTSYSQGKFGFRVQRDIWCDCNRPGVDGKDWEKFCVAVGWRARGSTHYVKSEALLAHLQDSPPGELPTGAIGLDRFGGLGVQTSFKVALLGCAVLSRLEACQPDSP